MTCRWLKTHRSSFLQEGESSQYHSRRARAEGRGRGHPALDSRRVLLVGCLARLDADLVEHVLPPEGLGHSARLVLGERVFGVEAGDLKDALVNHLDAELAERDAGRDLHLLEVVYAEAARLLDPVLYEGVAQGVLRLGHVQVGSFDDQAVFARLSLHGVRELVGQAPREVWARPTARTLPPENTVDNIFVLTQG